MTNARNHRAAGLSDAVIILPYGAPVDFNEIPQSALEREIVAEAATCPDLSDHLVGVAVNHISMLPSESKSVAGKHGSTSAREHDARPITSPGGRASIEFECPDIPEFLRRAS